EFYFFFRLQLIGDVGADTQYLDVSALLMTDNLVGPGNPSPFPIATHVLVDVLLEGLGISTHFLHEPLQIAATPFAGGHNRSYYMPSDYLIGRVAEKSLPEFVEEEDAAIGCPREDNAVGGFHQFTVLLFVIHQGLFYLLALGDIDTHAH